MIKAGIAPIIFVINNEGYTVERLIWGAQQRKVLLSLIKLRGLTLNSVQRHRPTRLCALAPALPPPRSRHEFPPRLHQGRA
jgi:hypothetical protein